MMRNLLPVRRPAFSVRFPGVWLAISALLATAPAALAQELGNDPYSRLGVGQAPPGAGLVRNQGMGGVGVALPNGTYVNDLNPALTFYTRQVTFEFGVTSRLQKLKSAGQSQRDGNATLGYLALGLPISKRWGTTIGLRPFSSVDYKSRSLLGVENDPAGQIEIRYTGKGDLSQAYMAHGVRIGGGLTVGAEASYVFGNVESSQASYLVAGTDVVPEDERTVLLENRRYGDLVFRTGLHYYHEIAPKLNLNVGGALQFGEDLTTRRSRRQERQQISANGAVLQSTLLEDSVRGTVKLPYQVLGGVGLGNGRTWETGVDVQFQPWSQFRQDGQAQRPLADSWMVRAGGEWTPDPGAVDSYVRRITYRAGLNLGEPGFRDRAQRPVREAAVTWGFALPLGKSSSFENAMVQTSFAYGQRWSATEGALRSSFVRAQLGFTLSSTWFTKRRLE